MKDFVLKGNICHSKSPTELEVLPHGYAVCVDGVARGAFRTLPEPYAALPVVDFGDRLVLPGLVDLHIHAPQYAYRGTGMDLELMDWLTEQAFPEEARYGDLDYARAAYAVFAAQLRKSATTRACIFATQHRPATELLMELMEDTGLVTFVGKVNMDREASEVLREQSAEVSAAETADWLAATGRFQRTKPILTPRFVPSCTDALMEKLRELQSAHGLPVQSHLSESQGEIELVRRLHPESKFYGEVYDSFGLFGKNHVDGRRFPTVMAHCVWSSEEEISLMRENGVFVAHCPASNTNLSSGIAPVRRYLDSGLRVGLGSDVAGGHSDSILRAVTDAVQVSKLYWRLVDPSVRPISFPEGFYMATRGGGAFFGQAGCFDEGCAFDAVVLDDALLPAPREQDLLRRLERAAYLSLDLLGVHAKIVDGRRLF